MLFWLWMTMLGLLIPILMLGFGYYYRKHIPKTMRSGYRTARSRKSRETWVYAHRMLGGIWSRSGWLLLALSFGAMLFAADKDRDTISTMSGAISMIQAAVMALSFIPIERALKQNFDENGFPVNEEAREKSREDEV